MASAYYTYISRKQIGVIFGNWKSGKIAIEKDVIDWLYKSCCEVRSFNNNNDFEDVLVRVKSAIDEIFNGNHEEAAKSIECAYTKYHAIYKVV